jgi:hypothetical protein
MRCLNAVKEKGTSSSRSTSWCGEEEKEERGKKKPMEQKTTTTSL